MPPGSEPESYRVGDLVIDVTGACVSRRGERLVLPPRTFELLVALVRHYPATVRRPELLDSVWPDETVSDQTLSHRVMLLRKAIGDHAEEPAYVAGERGFGYRLVAPAERISPDEQDHAHVGGVSPASRARSLGRPVAVTIAVALLALALIVGRHAWPGLARAPTAKAALGAETGAARDGHLERLCLRGEFYFLSFTEDGLRRSAAAWEQAVALAPGHARAHAGWALTLGVRALLDQAPPPNAEGVARAGARRALELDPACPAAHLATSLVRLLFDWDAAGAVAMARTAIQVDRDDLRGPVVLALALQGLGRLEESEQVLGAAILEDPFSTASLFLKGRTHEMQGRWGEAVASYTRALELEPDLLPAQRGSAECLTAAGRKQRALVVLGAAVPDSRDPDFQLRVAWRRLCLGGRTSGETVRACVLGGETERAERLLASAVDARAPFVVLTPNEALLQPLRVRPLLRALAARLQQPHAP